MWFFFLEQKCRIIWLQNAKRWILNFTVQDILKRVNIPLEDIANSMCVHSRRQLRSNGFLSRFFFSNEIRFFIFSIIYWCVAAMCMGFWGTVIYQLRFFFIFILMKTPLFKVVVNHKCNSLWKQFFLLFLLKMF